jgi:hypothetical protein
MGFETSLFSAPAEVAIADSPPAAYEDTVAVLAGRAPLSQGRPSPAQSLALLNRLLDSWRVLPSLSNLLVAGALESSLLPEHFERLRNCWLSVSAFTKAQFRGYLPLLEALQQSGLNYSLLKGVATGFRLYTNPADRGSTDIDFGVRSRDLRAAEDLATDSGFHPAQKNDWTQRFEPADPGLRAMVEARHYELCFFVRRLQVVNLDGETLDAIRAEPWARRFWLDVETDAPWCYAIVDIHHALSLDIGVEELLTAAQVVQSGEWQARVPSDAWLTAHLIYKIYWEGVHNYGKGLYQFADLVRLVPLLDSRTFSVLVAILERHNLVAAGHYVLRRLATFGIDVPDHVLGFIEDTRIPPMQGSPTHQDPFDRSTRADPGRLNDLGDMWARLWGHR